LCVCVYVCIRTLCLSFDSFECIHIACLRGLAWTAESVPIPFLLGSLFSRASLNLSSTLMQLTQGGPNSPGPLFVRFVAVFSPFLHPLGHGYSANHLWK
jgi:hypothetical protein